jgi:hypothetical protein
MVAYKNGKVWCDECKEDTGRVEHVSGPYPDLCDGCSTLMEQMLKSRILSLGYLKSQLTYNKDVVNLWHMPVEARLLEEAEERIQQVVETLKTITKWEQ